jgi:hypothetical protein
MSQRRSGQSRGWLIALPLLLALSVPLRAWLDRELRLVGESTGADVTAAEAVIPARVARLLAGGFQAVLADWYWIRTLNYFGRQAREQEKLDLRRMPQLAGLLRLTVALDPQQLAAWRFGAFFLGEGDLSDPGEGWRFVTDGIRENPREWRLRADLAFICWRAGRYREAALAWQQAAALPGAPAWIEPMAAITLGQGGEVETARIIFRRLIESTDDPFVREVSRFQLDQLEQ